jgi:uncharacterized protein
MKYTFSAKGHPNILATHKSTLEITADSELTEKGNCIVAVSADFSLQELQKVILGSSDGKIILTLAAAGITEYVTATANRNFSSNHDIVLRTGSFLSERTLGTRADKAAEGLDRRLVKALASGDPATITITTL